MAKPRGGTYEPGKRAMLKIKHARTADCVVAGFRWHKNGTGTLVGSLLLGLYDDAGALHHVGVTSSFTMAKRAQLAQELAPLREDALDAHPVARLGERGERRRHAHAGRAEPLERRQGPVVGAAAHRARVRGEVRPPAGRPLSARGRSSCAGAPTSRRATAATISSRSRRLTSSRRSSARRGSPRSTCALVAPATDRRRDRALPAPAAAPPARAAG